MCGGVGVCSLVCLSHHALLNLLLNQGPCVAVGVVPALLMMVLLVVCVGVPVCYCGWRKKVSELETPTHLPHTVYTSVVCKLVERLNC